MIQFFNEDIEFGHNFLSPVPSWLTHAATDEKMIIGDLNYVFCSDNYLLEINRTYLDHDYYTDIITFDNCDQPGHIEGDIFISLDRVRENSSLHQTSFQAELLRVIIHGLLHLIGYDDRDDNSQITMRKMEDKYLDLYFQSFYKAGS